MTYFAVGAVPLCYHSRLGSPTPDAVNTVASQFLLYFCNTIHVEPHRILEHVYIL